MIIINKKTVVDEFHILQHFCTKIFGNKKLIRHTEPKEWIVVTNKHKYITYVRMLVVIGSQLNKINNCNIQVVRLYYVKNRNH